MNGQNGHVDGDDYTYDVPTGGAVFNPLAELAAWDQAGAVVAFAELRERFGAHFDAIEDVDAWVREQRGGPDLRTAAEKEQADVAALDRRLAALEATVARLVKVLEVRL